MLADADAERHRQVRTGVAELDVPDDWDISIAEHREHEVAQVVRTAIDEVEGEAGAHDHAGDPIEDPGRPKDVELRPDPRALRPRLFPEQDLAQLAFAQ